MTPPLLPFRSAWLGFSVPFLLAGLWLWQGFPPISAERLTMAPPSQVGAPEVALATERGDNWKLSSLRDKRAALMVFWASW
ncbi:MAG: hypothetical protein VKP62_09385 [Candidatus Sericytochromatia bacterium]|nr:hypothetical protein [Candidatus Sericytochromatia bacterium]